MLKHQQLLNSYNELKESLKSHSYISHRQSQKIINNATNSMPKNIWGYIRLIKNYKALKLAIGITRLAQNYDVKRQNHNKTFIEEEIVQKSNFFENINGHSLDIQQIHAVLSDEDNTLVIAGAGSGKTLTIEAKIRYLIKYENISPESILPISFTNKSSQAMKERINIQGIEPMTFHKFCLNALYSVESWRPSIYDGSKNKYLFNKFIKELSEDQSFIKSLNNFFINYSRIPKSEFEFSSLGDYIQYLKDQNFSTYKKIKIPYKGKNTYRNEIVKSIQECIIANYLLFNNIDYEYEAPYKYNDAYADKVPYKPDFTIHTENGDIYLENFGIDKNCNVPLFFASSTDDYEKVKKKYLDGIRFKRDLHKANHTKLIETFSYEFFESGFLDKLRDRLIRFGVNIRPMSESDMWQTIKDSNNNELESFIELVTTFLALMKSNRFSIDYLYSINSQINKSTFQIKRTQLFLELFEPIYRLYEKYLTSNHQIDFNDMITRATAYIENSTYVHPLKYVIIDEFQDISVNHYRLLEAIRKQNPDVKFYCVGDDWQSIYRFAGSDIALFRDFNDYFGYTTKQKIETTYRFGNPLIDISSEFISKNPNQTIKHLIAPQREKPTTLSVIESDSVIGDDTKSLAQALKEITDDNNFNDKSSIYIIGRYSFDIKRIKNYDNIFEINYNTGIIKYTVKSGKFIGLKINISFCTAHKSKGLEADYVIIINCNSGKMGFPSERADDPLLSLLLSRADQYPNGEERRLFYVALTRAKNKVIILADQTRKSKFIKELQNEVHMHILTCPRCKNGELIFKKGKYGDFYACSNYLYGCNYTIKASQSEPKHHI